MRQAFTPNIAKASQSSIVVQQVKQPINLSLVAVMTRDVLPVLQTYFSSSNFDWKGNLDVVANEYAEQLTGCNIAKKHITLALSECKALGANQKKAPNPMEFKIMCLQAAGMPTLDDAMQEVNFNRIHRYGKDKEWSQPFVYWLNQRISIKRNEYTDAAWQRFAAKQYSELAVKFAKGEIKPIPLRLEHKVQPAFERYDLSEAAAEKGAALLARIRGGKAA
jgi:hypothetical protein